jgi:hypothetical protein
MSRAGVVAALLALLGCDGRRIIVSPPPCAPVALCALQFTLIVTGRVRASLAPITGATVHVTAYRDSCTGSEIMLLPSPAEAVTDSNGVYVMRAEVTQSAASACVRVAYSNALFSDTSGVALHAPPGPTDTLRVDVTGP